MKQPTDQTPRKRGFALLDAKKRSDIASLGGRTAHETGRAHQFTPEEARAASRRSLAVRTRKAAEARASKAGEGPAE